jgi:hypothetical protein
MHRSKRMQGDSTKVRAQSWLQWEISQMKHPDEYAWELMHGLEEGDMHKDYIENAGFKYNNEFVINRDGLRYVEKFMRRVIEDVKNERATENR